MIKERAGTFLDLWISLEVLDCEISDDEIPRPEQITKSVAFCDEFAAKCEKFEWESLAAQARRFKDSIQDRYSRKEEQYGSNLKNERVAVRALLDDLQKSLWDQLAAESCLILKKNHRSHYEQNTPLFGAAVASNFLPAAQDIAEAGRCFALNRWTACVFHLMRVLEKGLLALADELSVPFKIPFEYENWQNIIEPIESKIRELEKLPKGLEKTEKLRIYSEAAKQFRYFKDAWRNHVSHSRVTYDEEQAETIMHHVREFMQDLAKNGLMAKII